MEKSELAIRVWRSMQLKGSPYTELELIGPTTSGLTRRYFHIKGEGLDKGLAVMLWERTRLLK